MRNDKDLLILLLIEMKRSSELPTTSTLISNLNYKNYINQKEYHRLMDLMFVNNSKYRSFYYRLPTQELRVKYFTRIIKKL